MNPFSRILIIGDSNVHRMIDEIAEDKKLGKYNIVYGGGRGFRVSQLDGSHVVKARYSSHVIIICGNNDLSSHGRNVASHPEEVIVNLAAFARVIHSEGAEVAVLGLLSRRDHDKSETLLKKVSHVNLGLRQTVQNLYVGPRGITRKYFAEPDNKDPYHLDEEGRANLRKIIFQIIRDRFLLL